MSVIKDEFEKQLNKFVDPIIKLIEGSNFKCRIYWVWPEEPENNKQYPWELDDCIHYLTAFIGQGYRTSVRILETFEDTAIEITIWESDGSDTVYWHDTDGRCIYSDSWMGYRNGG